ncbi:hypothetical protein NPIL_693451 [Nephila pilipes]|uniref:Uncharacterized protein n=1 Tax=Nephila pilipes TaxID=299642 RepID=A0A8X6T708_NEPPI|nr:hypothetical protein NPIL_693451 [Nephila pilipes]
MTCINVSLTKHPFSVDTPETTSKKGENIYALDIKKNIFRFKIRVEILASVSETCLVQAREQNIAIFKAVAMTTLPLFTHGHFRLKHASFDITNSRHGGKNESGKKSL